MKNTKFRKRALLSSVAMLLVALVALGSATFAWFTANTKVQAKDFKVKATTADGLKISKQAIGYTGGAAGISDWAQSVDLDTIGTAWNPVSPLFSGTTATWYTGSAEAYTSYALGSNTTTSGATDYYATQLWLKSTKSGITKLKVTATFSAYDSASVAPYVRVAIISAETGNAITYLGDEANETWTPLTTGGAVGSSTLTAYATVDTLDKTNLSVGEQFYVYIWLEGQDEDCKDANAGLGVEVDLEFEIV